MNDQPQHENCMARTNSRSSSSCSINDNPISYRLWNIVEGESREVWQPHGRGRNNRNRQLSFARKSCAAVAWLPVKREPLTQIRSYPSTLGDAVALCQRDTVAPDKRSESQGHNLVSFLTQSQGARALYSPSCRCQLGW